MPFVNLGWRRWAGRGSGCTPDFDLFPSYLTIVETDDLSVLTTKAQRDGIRHRRPIKQTTSGGTIWL
jgi:hypothetical protein